jgi:hypothetical protein
MVEKRTRWSARSRFLDSIARRHKLAVAAVFDDTAVESVMNDVKTRGASQLKVHRLSGELAHTALLSIYIGRSRLQI